MIKTGSDGLGDPKTRVKGPRQGLISYKAKDDIKAQSDNKKNKSRIIYSKISCNKKHLDPSLRARLRDRVPEVNEALRIRLNPLQWRAPP